MALLLKSTRAFGARAVAPRAKVAVRAAERELWYPGNTEVVPAHLDGTLVGDHGFDPLNLGAVPEDLRWNVQAELIHGRWAMLATAGIMFTGVGAQAGLDFPQWYEAGKVALASGSVYTPGFSMSYPTLLMTTFLLMGWAETKRWYDFKNPGSQGDGSFLGFTDELKGMANGYPGGKWFDPMGLSRGTPKQLRHYQWAELRNGRLAMVAMLGFFSQYIATGKGPIQNLADHLADPYHVTFATNGVSLPFLH